MQKKNKLRLGVASAVAVVALALGAAAPAYAEPTPSGSFRDLVGVGSDTTENVMNGLAGVISSIGSYDATPVGVYITTRPGGTPFMRPNGSGQGVSALTASINPGGTRTWPAAASTPVTGGTTFPPISIAGQVDFARSSSAPTAALASGTDLTFIPFARDAVTYAVSAASDFPRDIAWGNLPGTPTTAFTLKNIYLCNVTTYPDADFNSIPIRPLIPQSGSGTRSFWIGSAALNITPGPCVTSLNNSVQEHNGTFVTGPGDIVPFSIAQYISQGNWASLTGVTERRGNIQLGNIDTIKPYVPAAGGGIELNASFPINRLVFNVVQASRLDTTGIPADTALQAAFKGTGSQVCSAAATIRSYGFATIGSLCGNTTTYHQSYPAS